MSDLTPTPSERLAGAIPKAFEDVAWTEAVPSVASPSWVAGDSVMYEGISTDGRPLLARVLRGSAAIHADIPTMFRFMQAAGESGIAPEMLFSDAGCGVCIQERLDESWQVGTLDRLRDAGTRLAVASARERVRALEVSAPRVSVFDRVDTLWAYADRTGIGIPPLADDIVLAVRQAAQCVRTTEQALPCHGDGAASNVMLSSQGVRLVGWTEAALMDPLAEIGSVLTEFAPYVTDAESAFEAMWGRPDPPAFARAQLYALADDLKWALIGWCAQAAEPESPIEFQRYANWRLFKARCAISDGQRFSRWLEEAA